MLLIITRYYFGDVNFPDSVKIPYSASSVYSINFP